MMMLSWMAGLLFKVSAQPEALATSPISEVK